MNTQDFASKDPAVQGGTLVFEGTRVPVKTITNYLRHNYTVDAVLEQFPSVKRGQVEAFLERAVQLVEVELDQEKADAAAP